MLEVDIRDVCGNSSMVEYSLAKARVEGSNPFFRFQASLDLVAEWSKLCARSSMDRAPDYGSGG